MNEVNIKDPWSVKVEENNIGEPLKFSNESFLCPSFKLHVPETVGYWGINENFQVHVAKRPNWLHRKMTKFLLGWIWKDT